MEETNKKDTKEEEKTVGIEEIATNNTDISSAPYHPKEEDELNDLGYLWNLFGYKPSKYTLHSMFDGGALWDILRQESEMVQSDIITNGEIILNEDVVHSTRYLIKLENSLYISFYEYKTEEEYQCSNLIFYYDGRYINNDLINTYFEAIEEAIVNFSATEEGTLNYINVQQGQLEIEPVFRKGKILPDKDSNLSFFDFYPRKINKDMKAMVKNIKTNTNGLYLLYGEDGTGKTAVINHLSDNINKPVIIVPFNIIQTFLSGIDLIEVVKQNPNTLFVLDDCESILKEYGRSIFKGLLQITNGILRRSVLSSFLLIFNTDSLNNIGEEIYQKSDISIKFDKLSVGEIKIISKDMGLKKIPEDDTKIGLLFKDLKQRNRGSYL